MDLMHLQKREGLCHQLDHNFSMKLKWTEKLTQSAIKEIEDKGQQVQAET